MISSRVGCVWNGCERNGSMFARTMSSSLFGTTSERHSHSSSVHGETKSTFSAAVTKRRLERSGVGLLMRSVVVRVKIKNKSRIKRKAKVNHVRNHNHNHNPNQNSSIETIKETTPSTRRQTVSCRAHRGD